MNPTMDMDRFYELDAERRATVVKWGRSQFGLVSQIAKVTATTEGEVLTDSHIYPWLWVEVPCACGITFEATTLKRRRRRTVTTPPPWCDPTWADR